MNFGSKSCLRSVKRSPVNDDTPPFTRSDISGRTRLSLTSAINEARRANSLGWKMEADIFTVVASTAQHDNAARIIDGLEAAQLRTSARELREAHSDLSRRPLPDISGGIQHAGAAIECLAREISGDTKLSLGDIIKKREDLFPGAYRKMADAMWGIVSNQGRHMKEEGEASLKDALFVVGSITNLAAFLLAQRPTASQLAIRTGLDA